MIEILKSRAAVKHRYPVTICLRNPNANTSAKPNPAPHPNALIGRVCCDHGHPSPGHEIEACSTDARGQSPSAASQRRSDCADVHAGVGVLRVRALVADACGSAGASVDGQFGGDAAYRCVRVD